MDRNYTPEELAAIELGHALANLGPDTDHAVMVTLRLPNGQYVRDVWLSKKDTDALIDGALAIAAYRNCDDDTTIPLLPIDDTDVNEMVAALEDLANGEL